MWGGNGMLGHETIVHGICCWLSLSCMSWFIPNWFVLMLLWWNLGVKNAGFAPGSHLFVIPPYRNQCSYVIMERWGKYPWISTCWRDGIIASIKEWRRSKYKLTFHFQSYNFQEGHSLVEMRCTEDKDILWYHVKRQYCYFPPNVGSPGTFQSGEQAKKSFFDITS